MKMDSISPVSAELSTEVVIKNAGVWTEMEARLKDWKNVVSIQNNPDQTLISYFDLNSKHLQKFTQFILNVSLFHQHWMNRSDATDWSS